MTFTHELLRRALSCLSSVFGADLCGQVLVPGADRLHEELPLGSRRPIWDRLEGTNHDKLPSRAP